MRLIVLVLAFGCSTKPNPKSCLDGHCSDPDLPFCDVDGRIGGEPNTCIAVECSPGAFETCRGDAALTCNAAGDSYELVACQYGCGATGCNACNTADCERHIIPKYLPTICNQLALGEPVTFDTQTLDTSNALNCTAVVTQSQGPDICVYRASAITLAANKTVRVVGTRSLAFVADRDLVIDGVLDISADSDQRAHGPGGGTEISGGLGDNAGTGGGGAGFKTQGGPAGRRNGIAQNGGGVAANPALLTYLVGGTAPPRTADAKYQRGHAGGAATLISCRGTVIIAGLVDANGGGGEGGHVNDGGIHIPAGGGASGGNVVIQGMNVRITGQLFANGGGGGGGEDQFNLANALGYAGTKGLRGTTQASGGIQSGHGSKGGDGGSAQGVAAAAANATATGYGGGGGGSVGFLQSFTPADVSPQLSPSLVSPPLEGNLTIPTNR